MPAIQTEPRSIERQDELTKDYVLDRFEASRQFDRPFKDAALRHWQQLNNILPADWPYFSRYFEPETQNSASATIEGIMSRVFEKDNYFEVEPVEEQDEVQTEIMRELMKYVLREKIQYKLMKYYQLQQAVYYGNGVERHIVEPRIVRVTRRVEGMMGDAFQTSMGTNKRIEEIVEIWPKSRIVERFDCFPAPIGADIQSMPYFIERQIVPLDRVKAMAKIAGYRNTDKIDGFMSLDRTEGHAFASGDEQDYDQFGRLMAIGYDVRGTSRDSGIGENAVKYTEILTYSEAPPGEDGCGRVVVLADREWVLKDTTNPFDHGLKSYSEIKFAPSSATYWQARGVPDLVETLQDKLNVRLAQAGDIIELIRSPMTYVGAAAGVEDLSDLDEWPGAQIPVADPHAIVERTRPGVPPEIYRDIDYTRAGIQRAGGAVDYARGMAGQDSGLSRGTETATGIQLLLNAANQAKTFRWMLAEETGIAAGLNIIASLIQQVVGVPQKIKILGENKVLTQAGYKQFLTVTPDDIAGRWNFYAVGAARATELNSQATLITQQLPGMMQMPDVQPRVKQLELTIELAEMFGLKNFRRFLRTDEEMMADAKERQAKGEPDPKAEMERQKVLEWIANEYSLTPPDVQRQLEQMAGLKPSSIGGSSKYEALMAEHIQKQRETAAQAAPAAPNPELELAKHGASLAADSTKHREKLAVDAAKHRESLTVQERQHTHKTAVDLQKSREANLVKIATAPKPTNGETKK